MINEGRVNCSVNNLMSRNWFERLLRHKRIPAESKILRGGDPDGTRTRVTAVKGRCLNRLTTGPYDGNDFPIRLRCKAR